MFSANVFGMFAHLVAYGIEVSLHQRPDGVFLADLHTQAKSHLHLSEKDGKVVFDMRYGKQREISADEEPVALAYEAAACYAYECICGRGFGSDAWDQLCEELDITVCYGHLQ